MVDFPAPVCPTSVYGLTKYDQERLCLMWGAQHEVPVTALRFFNVYGPRLAMRGPHTEVLIRWMERIESGAAPIIFGDGSDVVDFVDVSDIARANLLAAQTAVSDDDKQRLAALGYVGGGSSVGLSLPGDSLPDPKDKVKVLEKYRHAADLAGGLKFDEAVALYREVLAEDPDMTDVWLQLAGRWRRENPGAIASKPAPVIALYCSGAGASQWRQL